MIKLAFLNSVFCFCLYSAEFSFLGSRYQTVGNVSVLEYPNRLKASLMIDRLLAVNASLSRENIINIHKTLISNSDSTSISFTTMSNIRQIWLFSFDQTGGGITSIAQLGGYVGVYKADGTEVHQIKYFKFSPATNRFIEQTNVSRSIPDSQFIEEDAFRLLHFNSIMTAENFAPLSSSIYKLADVNFIPPNPSEFDINLPLDVILSSNNNISRFTSVFYRGGVDGLLTPTVALEQNIDDTIKRFENYCGSASGFCPPDASHVYCNGGNGQCHSSEPPDRGGCKTAAIVNAAKKIGVTTFSLGAIENLYWIRDNFLYKALKVRNIFHTGIVSENIFAFGKSMIQRVLFLELQTI